jgi:dihydrofolate reductase
MPEISIIAAMDDFGGIGFQGHLPWKNPQDLANFKKQTMGSSLIMGRLTWESLPKTVRPLPGRISYILSRQAAFNIQPMECEYNISKGYKEDTVFLARSIPNALSHIGQSRAYNRDIYIIGGAQVYEEALKLEIVDRIILTRMKRVYQCDTYFPRITNGVNYYWNRYRQQSNRNWERFVYTKVVV